MREVSIRDLTDEQLEHEHRALLVERDGLHNHLRHVDRKLEAVRAERLARASHVDGEDQC